MSDLNKCEYVKKAVSEALSALEDFWNDNEIREYDVYSELHDLIRGIADVPAVEQPMSAVEYLAAEQRMCFDENVGKINCSACPLSSRINPARINCGDYSRQHPEKAIATVEKWVQEHPERINEDGK